jgi:hypothetical protein
MKDASASRLEKDDENIVLLDTVIAAHYLALQMRGLPESKAFRGREATEFLAAALTEWARLVEDEVLTPNAFLSPSVLCGRH